MPRTAIAIVLIVLGVLIGVGVLPASALVVGGMFALVGGALLV